MRRAVAIFERSLGPYHPNTRMAHGNLAILLDEIASQKAPPPPAPAGATAGPGA